MGGGCRRLTFELVVAARDDAARDRGLKWVLVLSDALLRKSRRGRNSRERNADVARRFTLWRDRDLRILPTERDRDHAAARSCADGDRGDDDAERTTRATIDDRPGAGCSILPPVFDGLASCLACLHLYRCMPWLCISDNALIYQHCAIYADEWWRRPSDLPSGPPQSWPQWTGARSLSARRSALFFATTGPLTPTVSLSVLWFFQSYAPRGTAQYLYGPSVAQGS